MKSSAGFLPSFKRCCFVAEMMGGGSVREGRGRGKREKKKSLNLSFVCPEIFKAFP